MQLKGLQSMYYLNSQLTVQMGFQRQNYWRDHGSDKGQGKPLCHHIYSEVGND